jgi:hypothetical protein
MMSRRVTLSALVSLLMIAAAGPGRSPLGTGVVRAAGDPWINVGTADFDRDGQVDVLMRHETSGLVEAWLLEGIYIDRKVPLSTQVQDLAWSVRGVGDFNGDGHADIVWHHAAAGQLALWLMDRWTMTSGSFIDTSDVPDPAWRLQTIGDFNGDGKADLLWHHATAGGLWAWFMNGPNRLGTSQFTPPGVSDIRWTPVATGDFNRDGRTDIVWRHTDAGEIVVWYMDPANNGTVLHSGTFTSPPMPDLEQPAQWLLKGTGDFNGDGHVDIIWRRPFLPESPPCLAPTGQNVVWFMNNVSMQYTGEVYGEDCP